MSQLVSIHKCHISALTEQAIKHIKQPEIFMEHPMIESVVNGECDCNDHVGRGSQRNVFNVSFLLAVTLCL